MFALKGYIVERYSTIVMMSANKKKYVSDIYNIDDLLTLSRVEVNLHLEHLLSVIKNNENPS